METARFERGGAAAHLQFAASQPGLLCIYLEGWAQAFADEVILGVSDGGIHEVIRPNFSVQRVLLWIALAPAIRVGRHPGRSAYRGARAIPFSLAYAEAERRASKLLDIAKVFGGLGAVLEPDHRRMMTGPDLPEEAARVLRRVDAERTAAEVVAGAPLDPELGIRVLARLHRDRFVFPGQGRPHTPEPVAPEGEHDIRRQLAESPPPESLTTEQGFLSAFAASSKQESPRSPPPAEPDEADWASGPEDELLQEAGLRRRFTSWILVGFALLAAAGAAGIFFAQGDMNQAPAAAIEPAAAVQTATATATSSAAVFVEPLLSAPPPVKKERRPRKIRPLRVEGPLPKGTPIEQAEALLELGDPEAAERILLELRPRRPRSDKVWRLSAQAAVDLGRNREALKFAQRSLARAPRSPDNWLVKGSALQFAGRTGEAVAAYERAIRLAPESARVPEIRQVIEQLKDLAISAEEAKSQSGLPGDQRPE